MQYPATRRFRLTALFLLLPLYLCAGDGFRFRYIHLPPAVRDASIGTAVVDRAGMLWLVTASGLHRYDGNQLLTFNRLSQPALPDKEISALHPDRFDRLWINFMTELWYFDLQRWQLRRVSFGKSHGDAILQEITEGRNGTIYISDRTGRLFRVESDSLRLVADLGAKGSIPGAVIRQIDEVKPGEIWVITNGKLARIRQGRVDFPAMPPLPERIAVPAYYHSSGKIYFNVVNHGMYVYNPRTGKAAQLRAAFNNAGPRRPRFLLFPLLNGDVGIVAYRTGVFRVNPLTDSVSDVTSQVSADSGAIYAPRTFRTGTTAYLVNNNISEIAHVHTPFHNLLMTPALESRAVSVRSILRHPDGWLYLGTYNGFIRINESTGAQEKLPPGFVYTAMLWDDGRILAATEGDGLRWFDPVGRKFSNVPMAADGAFPDAQQRGRYLTSLARENDSLVWVGAYSGVYLLNVYTGAYVAPKGGADANVLQDARINKIVKSGNHVYFATSAGVFSYDGNNVHRILGDVSVYSLVVRKNELWAGTQGHGVWVLDESGKVKREFNTANGLAGNMAYTLLEQDGQIIAGTDGGLALIDPHTGDLRTYARMQHLPSNEFNHSAAATWGGRVYLGTINGMTSFSIPELLQYRDAGDTIPVRFTSFSAGSGNHIRHRYDLPYTQHAQLELGPDERSFSLHFGGIAPSIDQVYYYRLHDDAPWTELGRQQEMRFAGIAPGRYRIELAVKQGSGDRYVTLLTMPVTVRPAWFETLLFKLGCIAVALLIAWLLFRLRVRRLLREQRLRTKIAGDLHDEVGSSLTRIYFKADQLSLKHTERDALQKIADSSKRALGAMSDMVWSIDARFDTAGDLVDRIRDYLSSLQQDLDIAYTFELTGAYEGKRLSQVIRQNFFLIFKEAVNNAARYSSEPRMAVRLSFAEDIDLRISNPACGDGVRIPQYQGGQGVHHMQQRAARMKGVLRAGREGDLFIVELRAPW
ncbi:hypothetical protein ACWKWU_00590 [Chitinophaga lutea]